MYFFDSMSEKPIKTEGFQALKNAKPQALRLFEDRLYKSALGAQDS